MQDIHEIIRRHAGQRGALLVALQEIQAHAGCVSEEAVGALAAAFNLSAGEVLGVLTFYPELRAHPRGRHRVCVCRGDSCAAAGGDRLAAAVEEHLGVSPGATTPDGRFTYDTVYCLGNCALSPSLSIDGEAYARLSPEDVAIRLEEADA